MPELKESLEQEVFDALRAHKIGGGVYPWTLHDALVCFTVEKSEVPPSCAATVVDNILRTAARAIVATIG